MKKLNEDQIVYLEKWASDKKKHPMTNEEKEVVSKIESFSKNDWKGVRLETHNQAGDLKDKLERLKRKTID